MKNKDEGKRKTLRLTTSLTIYRLGLRGNSVNKSTDYHRFWTQKPLKSPEITQKIFAGHFGTLRLQDRIFFPQSHQKSLETNGFLFIKTKSEHGGKNRYGTDGFKKKVITEKIP